MAKILDIDEFHKQVIKKLDDLCDRMARMEEKLQSHLSFSESKSRTTREKILIIIAVVGAIAATVQMVF